MLKKFTVSNYRSFEEPITLDFTNVRDYDFNEECIKDGLINKAIIYGKNAVGKTNFGRAIMDVKNMLILQFLSHHKVGFLNARSSETFARFEYILEIEGQNIEYIYEKYTENTIRFESLKIDNELLYSLDFDSQEGDFSSFQKYQELAFLNIDSWENHLSVLRYVLNNCKLVQLSILKKFESFVKGMFNSLPPFGSFTMDLQLHLDAIVSRDLVPEFEKFLHHLGIEIQLKVASNPEGKKEIYIVFEKKLLKFSEHASNGTLTLANIFFHLNHSDLTVLYLDEFDSTLHFKLSKLLLEKFKKQDNYQTVITTHNTDLMSNGYMRPDCYLLMTKNKITSLADATKRKLREGHDLEILYQSGGLELLNREVGVQDE